MRYKADVFNDNMTYVAKSLEAKKINFICGDNFDGSFLTNIVPGVDCFYDEQVLTILINPSVKITSYPTFKYCAAEEINGLDIENFVIDENNNSIAQMFFECKHLKHIGGIESMDISHVKDFSCLFWQCEELESIDLSSWEPNIVEDIAGMFYNCLNLKTVKMFEINDYIWLNNAEHMFKGCSNLSEVNDFCLFGVKTEVLMRVLLDPKGYYGITKSDIKVLNIINQYDTPYTQGLISIMPGLECEFVDGVLNIYKWPVLKLIGFPKEFFHQNTFLEEVTGLENILIPPTGQGLPFYDPLYNVWVFWTKSRYNDEFSGAANLSELFKGCTELKKIEGLDKIDMSNVKSINYMFANCDKLETINVSGWDIKSISELVGVFDNCKSLTLIEGINTWNVQKVKNISYLFNECSSLKELVLSDWNLGKIKADCTVKAFYNLNLLEVLDISNFSIDNVYSSDTFFGMSSLINIVLPQDFELDYIPDCPAKEEINRRSKLVERVNISDKLIIDYVLIKESKNFKISFKSSEKLLDGNKIYNYEPNEYVVTKDDKEYIFAGWFLDEECEKLPFSGYDSDGHLYIGGEEIGAIVNAKENVITAYAKFMTDYTIKFGINNYKSDTTFGAYGILNKFNASSLLDEDMHFMSSSGTNTVTAYFEMLSDAEYANYIKNSIYENSSISFSSIVNKSENSSEIKRVETTVNREESNFKNCLGTYKKIGKFFIEECLKRRGTICFKNSNNEIGLYMEPKNDNDYFYDFSELEVKTLDNKKIKFRTISNRPDEYKSKRIDQYGERLLYLDPIKKKDFNLGGVPKSLALYGGTTDQEMLFEGFYLDREFTKKVDYLAEGLDIRRKTVSINNGQDEVKIGDVVVLYAKWVRAYSGSIKGLVRNVIIDSNGLGPNSRHILKDEEAKNFVEGYLSDSNNSIVDLIKEHMEYYNANALKNVALKYIVSIAESEHYKEQAINITSASYSLGAKFVSRFTGALSRAVKSKSDSENVYYPFDLIIKPTYRGITKIVNNQKFLYLYEERSQFDNYEIGVPPRVDMKENLSNAHIELSKTNKTFLGWKIADLGLQDVHGINNGNYHIGSGTFVQNEFYFQGTKSGKRIKFDKDEVIVLDPIFIDELKFNMDFQDDLNNINDNIEFVIDGGSYFNEDLVNFLRTKYSLRTNDKVYIDGFEYKTQQNTNQNFKDIPYKHEIIDSWETHSEWVEMPKTTGDALERVEALNIGRYLSDNFGFIPFEYVLDKYVITDEYMSQSDRINKQKPYLFGALDIRPIYKLKNPIKVNFDYGTEKDKNITHADNFLPVYTNNGVEPENYINISNNDLFIKKLEKVETIKLPTRKEIDGYTKVFDGWTLDNKNIEEINVKDFLDKTELTFKANWKERTTYISDIALSSSVYNDPEAAKKTLIDAGYFVVDTDFASITDEYLGIEKNKVVGPNKTEILAYGTENKFLGYQLTFDESKALTGLSAVESTNESNENLYLDRMLSEYIFHPHTYMYVDEYDQYRNTDMNKFYDYFAPIIKEADENGELHIKNYVRSGISFVIDKNDNNNNYISKIHVVHHKTVEEKNDFEKQHTNLIKVKYSNTKGQNDLIIHSGDRDIINIYYETVHIDDTEKMVNVYKNCYNEKGAIDDDTLIDTVVYHDEFFAGSENSEYNVKRGFELRTPSRKGYVFEGWYDNNEYQGTAITKLNNFDYVIDLYAKWKKIEFNIIYHDENAKYIKFDLKTKVGVDEIVFLPTNSNIEKPGYEFEGWYYDDQYSKKIESMYGFQVLYKIQKDNFDVYAKFKKFDYIIKYDYGTKFKKGYKPIAVRNYGEKVVLPTADDLVLPADVRFLGWRFIGYNDPMTEIPSTYKGGDITCYAALETLYNIGYDLDGGSFIDGFKPVVSRIANETVILPDKDKLVRDGYIFEGWVDVSYPNKIITNIAGGNNINYNVKATWKKTKFEISYDLAGGNWVEGYTPKTQANINETILLEYGNKVAKRKGYFLSGWQQKGIPITLIKNIEEDYKLTAVWTKEERYFVINYVLNGGKFAQPAEKIHDIKHNTMLPRNDLDSLAEDWVVRDGYTFDGWYTDPDCSDKYRVYYLLGRAYTGSKIYAKWVINTDNRLNVKLRRNDSMTDVVLPTDLFSKFSSIVKKQDITTLEFLRTNETLSGQKKNIATGIDAYINGKNVIIAIAGNVNAKLPVNSRYYFKNLNSVTSIKGLDTLDATDVTSMGNMFEYCYKLKEIDISGLKPSNLKQFIDIFRQCKAVETINITGIDTSKVVDMRGIFTDCNNLKNIIGLETLSVDSANTLEWMFYGCKKLVELDLSHFKVDSSDAVSYMFQYANELQEVYVSNNWSNNKRGSKTYADSKCVFTEVDVEALNLEYKKLADSLKEKYIYDIKMGIGTTKEEAKKQLIDNGYTVVDTNLNDGTNGKYIYIGYTTTTNEDEAITAIGERWFNATGRNPMTYIGSYHKYNFTAVTDIDGKQWNTNESANDGSRWVYLYTSKDKKAGDAIKVFEVIANTTAKTISNLSEDNKYIVVTNSNDNGLSDFNRGNKGKKIYIRYQ